MDWLLIGIILSAFFLLGFSRLSSCIYIVALQGAMLSALPLLAKGSFQELHIVLMSLGTFAIKAVAMPFLLTRSIREASIRQEVEPIVSLHLSLFAGGGIAVLAFSSIKALPPALPPFSPMAVPVALTVVLIGFFLLVSRTKAITQVIGSTFDARFPEDSLPEIYNALHITSSLRIGDTQSIYHLFLI